MQHLPAIVFADPEFIPLVHPYDIQMPNFLRIDAWQFNSGKACCFFKILVKDSLDDFAVEKGNLDVFTMLIT